MPALSFVRRLVGRSRRLELLLVSPVLLLMAGHLALWCGYLWLGDRVEAAAQAAARAAATAGLPQEREVLARRAAARWLPSDARSLASHVVVQEGPGSVAVQVSYDASHWPIYRLRHVLPTPPRTVVKVGRTAITG